VPLHQVADGLGDLAQRVGPADGRREPARLDELPQGLQPGYDFGNEYRFGLDLILDGLDRRRRDVERSGRQR
jgi:hypothetical protein